MEKNKTALCLVAHPDDAEILCAGTLALLADKGWKIVIATMTPGQAGSTVLGPDEISIIRRAEAANSAALLNGNYHCLESEDVFIMYDRPTLLKAIELIRKVKPTIVFTASPSDYMLDHEITSKIAMTACLSAGIPNIKIDGTEPFNTVPSLYYCDAVQGKDILGQKVQPSMYVDISSTIDIKEKMLCCHKSQREWLIKIARVDEFVIMMKNFSAMNGKEIHCAYAEGFRQHLGFSYPSENILKAELGSLVHIAE
jgi:LmbE family N-acetylglucosaminyl deacetylase